MTLSNSKIDWRTDIVVVLACIVVATGVLFQEILWTPSEIALGESEVDLPAQLWILWWYNHPQKDLLVNAPFGGVNFYVLTPIHTLIARWFYPNVVLAHNIATWIGLVTSVIGGALLGRRFGKETLSMIIGIFAILGSAPLIAAFRDGTGEFIWVGVLAISIWCADRVRCDGRWVDTVLLSLVTFFCILCSWYYGAGALLMIAILAVLSTLNRWKLLLSIFLSVGGSGWWIRQFASSDFELRPVQSSLWEQLKFGGSGPIADAGMQDLSWIARTQLSLMEYWWMDLWVWALIALVWSGLRRVQHANIWLWITVLSFLVGMGSFAPSGWSLPMLYGNRLLEWFGVGMHLPFHVSTVGVLALIVLGLQASRPVLWIGGVLMGGHAFWSLYQTERWMVPRYDDLPMLQGPVLHINELTKPSHKILNDIMQLQMVHGQSMYSFPIFPTNLYRTEGISSIRKHLSEEISLKTFRVSGVNTIISPIASPIQRLSDCCLASKTTDWNVYILPNEMIE